MASYKPALLSNHGGKITIFAVKHLNVVTDSEKRFHRLQVGALKNRGKICVKYHQNTLSGGFSLLHFAEMCHVTYENYYKHIKSHSRMFVVSHVSDYMISIGV